MHWFYNSKSIWGNKNLFLSARFNHLKQKDFMELARKNTLACASTELYLLQVLLDSYSSFWYFSFFYLIQFPLVNKTKL